LKYFSDFVLESWTFLGHVSIEWGQFDPENMTKTNHPTELPLTETSISYICCYYSGEKKLENFLNYIKTNIKAESKGKMKIVM
jgi:hypothetical protein